MLCIRSLISSNDKSEEMFNCNGYFFSSFSLTSRSFFTALFLHGGIWIMQAGRHTSRLRGGFIIFRRGTETRGLRSWENFPIRSGDNLQAGVYHHCVSKCLLLYGQFRRGEGENAVKEPIKYRKFWKTNEIERGIDSFFFIFRAFANQIQRPFGLRYNPYTQSVEVLTDAQKITAVVSELRGDLCIVSNALRKIQEQDDTVDIERITSLLTQGIELPQDTSSSDSDVDKSPNIETPEISVRNQNNIYSDDDIIND